MLRAVTAYERALLLVRDVSENARVQAQWKVERLWQIRSRLVQAEIEARGERNPAGPFALVRLDPARPPPAPIAGGDHGVALEWHRALNWVVRYCDEDWDGVSADT